MLETELCQFRDIRFKFDMLLWLKEEYDAWMDDRLFSDATMPTTGQATIAAIYILADNCPSVDAIPLEEDLSRLISQVQPPLGNEQRQTDLKKFSKKLADGLDLNSNRNIDFLTAFEILAIVDTQMAAVLEHSGLEKDPLEQLITEEGKISADLSPDTQCPRLYAKISDTAKTTQLPQIEETVSNNRVTDLSKISLDSYIRMKNRHVMGGTMTLINSLLIAVAGIIPIWNLDWYWYWLTAISIIWLIILFRFITKPAIGNINDKFCDKFEMMSINYRHLMSMEAGLIEPKSRIKDMAESRNSFWKGLIIGAIIGIPFSFIGMVIGAIIGAIITSGSSEDQDEHGEGWQEIKICCPFKLWFTTILMTSLVIFEIVAFYII